MPDAKSIPNQIAIIVKKEPKSGCLKIKIAKGKVNIKLLNMFFQAGIFLDQNLASVKIKTGLANSEGWIFKTPKKQGWHDMISSTVVVKKRNIISGLLSLLSVIIISVLLSAGLLKSINQLNEKVIYITNINTNINKFY